VYTPNPGFTGTDSFNHKANDGKQDSNSGKVNIEVRGKK
jgi:Big-like domain-containing protein